MRTGFSWEKFLPTLELIPANPGGRRTLPGEPPPPSQLQLFPTASSGATGQAGQDLGFSEGGPTSLQCAGVCLQTAEIREDYRVAKPLGTAAHTYDPSKLRG